MRKFAAVIMAAGKSTRMKSAVPKAVHNICGKPMTRHVVDACKTAGITDIIVIIGHEAEKVKSALGDDLKYAYQTEQLGTGHACMQAAPIIEDYITDVLVLPGDAPLITSETISNLMQSHISENNAATLLTAVLEDASSYGRVVRSEDGSVARICEAKDASDDILAIREINTSIYCFKKDSLFGKLGLLRTDNVQGEYYLTDVIEMMVNANERVGAVASENPADTLGINNRVELANASAIMRKRILESHMISGVTIVDPNTTYIDSDVEIGMDTIIMPCSVIENGTKIGKNCIIGPFAHLAGVQIADGSGGK